MQTYTHPNTSPSEESAAVEVYQILCLTAETRHKQVEAAMRVAFNKTYRIAAPALKVGLAISLVCLLMAGALAPAFAEENVSKTADGMLDPEVGIAEKLGDHVPPGIQLYDESGEPVALQSLMDKPVLLNLVYYRCPSICNPLMSSIAEVLRQGDMKAGEEFAVITVSFDDTDTPELAAEKKKNYFNTLPPDFPESGWRFMTADSANIKALTSAVGFNYIKEGNEFIHSAALIALSPDGKIVRYLYGLYYLPFDFKMAMLEASEGRVGPTVSRVLLFCYSFDPEGRKYVFNITRVAGAAGLVSVFALAIGLTIKGKKGGAKRKAG
jgi:protein SCO1/2